MGNQYAVELYSVRDELKKDLWGTLRKVKKMGYDAVEFAGFFAHTAVELQAALEDTGLICCGWHTPWMYVEPQSLFSTITYNKIIGNTDIVIPGLPGEMTGSIGAWKKSAERFNELAAVLAEYGMHLGYHNHSAEFIEIDGAYPYNVFYDGTENVGMQLDNGNALGAGPHVDIYGLLKKYPGRAKTLHLKPFSSAKKFATMIGEDDIDWPKFFKLSYDYQDVEWFIVEYECEELYSQLEGVERCIKALKAMEKEGKI